MKKAIENIFSIKNDLSRTHKTITICGIKLNIKSKKNKSKTYKQPPKYDLHFELGSKTFDEKFKYVLPIETIKNIISDCNIKIVSFDIFDTLLYRPCIHPTDIFYLIAKEVDKRYKINFVKLRLKAERLLNDKNANIHDIYNFIQKHYHLDKQLIDNLKKEEINCEKRILQVRDDVKEIFDFALDNKKKIIVTSDMYLSSDILKDILDNKGYSNITKIYVSNEYKARKNDGTLYDCIIKDEGVNADEICHIGDNFNSDYKIPLKKYITAIHYPSIKDILFNKNCIYNEIFKKDNISDDPITRILLGFSLYRVFKYPHEHFKIQKLFTNLSDFTDIAFAPVLFHIAMAIATDKKIQTKYNKVYFAARDGFLPKLAYDYIRENLDYCIPSEYLYASRRAYLPAIYDNLTTWFKDNIGTMESKTSIINMLKGVIYDESTINSIKNILTNNELNLFAKENKNKTIKILNKIQSISNKYLQDRKKKIIKYYNSVINTQNQRNIIFDIGYSGSISCALNKITNYKWDKIYLWQSSKNIKRDRSNHTTTKTLFDKNEIYKANVYLLYEELFSPFEGSCLGFDDNLNPILENINFSKNMQEDMELIKNKSLEYLKDIFETFGAYTKYLYSNNTNDLQQIIYYMITKSPYCETEIFKNIISPDPIGRSNPISLESKLSSQCYSDNVFEQTAFDNPKYYDNYSLVREIKTDKKLGIHIHLYNIHLLNEILYYLKDFPFSFDLIVTVCDKHIHNVITNILNQNTIKHLQNIRIINVQNRGRDIAPWLIATKIYQEEYDYFCHVHTKESLHFGEMGNDWRKYLYNNLIQKDSVKDIMALIMQNPKIGIVFPKTYNPLVNICIKNNVVQEGEFGEIKLIRNLAEKMGINRTFCYNTLIFSEGTMFWYNPKALKPLFDLNLSFEDFEKEPIGIGGTIAHAIERLPAFVCQEQGYEIFIYNN